MNESVAELGRDVFVLNQRLLEAHIVAQDFERRIERLRDAAASLAAELRVARERTGTLEAHVRRLESENAELAERLPRDLERARDLGDALVSAQREVLAAYETSNENELLVDSLQLQLVELRSELARARGLEAAGGDGA
jgi:septal ring factor EnvC (AmiA/AmiB activator)